MPSFQLATAFYAFVFIGLNDGAFGILIPSYQQYYGRDKTGFVIPFSTATGGYLLSALSSGLLRERLGQRLFLALGGAILLTMMAIMAGAPPWAAVVALTALGSFGVGVVDTGVNSYVA